jgi:hypothetical protein
VRVVADPRFGRWYRALPPATRASVASLLGFLSASSVDTLARPWAARIEGSRHFPKLWELRRAEHHGDREVVLRVLVAIHDESTAVALVGGDKLGNWVEWSQVAVPTADASYDDFLRRQT